MISVQMNDAAADSVGTFVSVGGGGVLDGSVPELRERAQAGVVRCGEVVVFADQVERATRPLGNSVDLTQWEVDASSFHLDDFVPVDKGLRDELGVPMISEGDQRRVLVQGLMLALCIARCGHSLNEPIALRCIIGANTTGGTFRFHRVRPGEQWHSADLDGYGAAEEEKVIVVETILSDR
ncbi:hypothetical protein ACIO52_02575 [Nocardia sp. NPDC087230]|uniref:hypothetical protein n=1 Tax=Nocardia sp. NPDC087230 TaxID=3364331 RepID=UPI0038272CCE